MKRQLAITDCRAPIALPVGRQDGIALVLVLWLVVLMTVIAASFATHSRVETRMAGNLVERQKAHMLIETGLNRAMLELMVSGNQRWPVDGEILELQEPQGRVRISLRNAAGLVDLNRASRSTLSDLFRLIEEEPGKRDRLVDALADWRDADNLRRINGAEDEDYARAGLDYGTADRDLESVDELSYVMGFNRDLVDAISTYATVFSTSSQLDERFASQSLIGLLGPDEAGQGSALQTAFDQLDSELAGLDGSDGLDDLGQSQRDSYRVSLEAITSEGARSMVDIDLKRDSGRGKPFSILAWHKRY